MTLTTQAEFFDTGLPRLWTVIESLIEEGWEAHVELIGQHAPPRGESPLPPWLNAASNAVLRLDFMDPDHRGTAGALPFFRIVKACEETGLSGIACSSHGMAAGQRRRWVLVIIEDP